MTNLTITVNKADRRYTVHLGGEKLWFGAGDTAVARDVPSGKLPLVWHFWGNPGDTFGIEAKVGGKSLFKLKDDPIPDGFEMSWGGTNLEVA